MTFDIAGKVWRNGLVASHNEISLAVVCRQCLRVAEVILRLHVNEVNKSQTIEQQTNANANHDVTRLFNGHIIYPPRPTPKSPQYVSANVERIFLEAEDNRMRKKFESAGMAYRKALDVATKEIMPSNRDMLAARLRKMQEEGRLTSEIADWAASVKQLGNDATHEPDAPTEDEVSDLANLTQMALVYLFEMPERVRQLRAADG